MRPRTIAVAVIASLTVGAPTAVGSVIHEPAPGASVQLGSSLYFDWAWTGGEYWTARINFTRAADKDDPIWFGEAKSGKARWQTEFGFGESHTTVQFIPELLFTPGQWYWRLCNYTVDGEDDKCYYDGSDPIPLTITPAPPPPPEPPPPPPDPCWDEVDNDSDGIIDLDDLDGSGCDSTPRPLPLTRAEADDFAREALSAGFGRRFDRARTRQIHGFWRASRYKVHYGAVSWRFGQVRFRGRLVISRRGADVPWRYSAVIRRKAPCRRCKMKILRLSGQQP